MLLPICHMAVIPILNMAAIPILNMAAISKNAAPNIAYGWPSGSRTWQVSNYWCAPDTGACHSGPCHTLHCTAALGDKFTT